MKLPQELPRELNFYYPSLQAKFERVKEYLNYFQSFNWLFFLAFYTYSLTQIISEDNLNTVNLKLMLFPLVTTMNRTSDLRVLILNLWSSTDKNSSFDPDDDFGLGCRNVSHFYRQQSFSGLPTPRWLKTARSNVTSGFKPFTIQTTILANKIS